MASVKRAGLRPFIVQNAKGEICRSVEDESVLRSAHVNSDHGALIIEIKEKLSRLANRSKFKVEAILNLQDRMWICYLDLKHAFPLARGVDCRLIELTFIKPNFRFALTESVYSVSYKLFHKDVCFGSDAMHSVLNESFPAKKLIVKPIAGMGGEGVSLIVRKKEWEPEQMKAAVERAVNAQKAVYSDRVTVRLHELGRELLPVNDYVLFEEFIEGIEYSLEGFISVDSELNCFLEQHKTVTRFNPTVRHFGYAFQKNKGRCIAREFTEEIAKMCGISGWGFHIEAKGKLNQIRPIEFNPRPGGGTIVDLVGLAHACDLRQLCLNSVLNAHLEEMWTGVAVIQPTGTGRLVACDGVDLVRRHPQCIFVRQLIPCGATVSQEIEMYVVELCVTAKTKLEATAAAQRLAGMIKLTIEKSP